MSGTAKLCDQDLLDVGAPCIIEVDAVNSPTGTWLGRVIETHVHDGWLGVKAVITSSLDGAPYRATGFSGGERVPSVNYQVYPDTPTVRGLFEKNQRLRRRIRELKKESARRQEDHHKLIEHLIRTGAVLGPEKKS